MSKEKILEMLIEIEGELDDAYYSLPDYNANSDSQSYIDGARCTLYHLKDEIEKSIITDKQLDPIERWADEDVTLDEVMNTSPTLAKGL
tara:strand:- start:48 stop:314 length:267 start_codon:yes stop_codon:yes gene_type:complete